MSLFILRLCFLERKQPTENENDLPYRPLCQVIVCGYDYFHWLALWTH